MPDFKNYYAVKACPNPEILRIMREEGFGADCSSLPEMVLAQQVGITGEDIMFTSNDTPDDEFKAAYDMGAVINLDDITHIDALVRSSGSPTSSHSGTTRVPTGPETQSSATRWKRNMG